MKTKAPPVSLTSRRLYHRRGARAQTLVEYALILAIISVVAIAMLMQLSTSTRGIYSAINSQLVRAGSS